MEKAVSFLLTLATGCPSSVTVLPGNPGTIIIDLPGQAQSGSPSSMPPPEPSPLITGNPCECRPDGVCCDDGSGEPRMCQSQECVPAPKVQICYSPLSGLEESFWGIIFEHASISASCGIWGFHPADNTVLNALWGPGKVSSDSGRFGLGCLDTGMTRCADDACVCKKIGENPGLYSATQHNCITWARDIISECQRR